LRKKGESRKGVLSVQLDKKRPRGNGATSWSREKLEAKGPKMNAKAKC